MFSKSKQKRSFRTTDLFLVVALGTLTVSLTVVILLEALRDNRGDRARFGAESLAHQMASGGLKFIDGIPAESVDGSVEPDAHDMATLASRSDSVAFASRGRRPASVPAGAVAVGPDGATGPVALVEGSIGQDPWGHAFHYKLLRANDGRALRILVWSSGPNSVSETRVADYEMALGTPAQAVRFGGDDIGFVY